MAAVVPLGLGEGGCGCWAGVEGLVVVMGGDDGGGVGGTDGVGGGKTAVGGADGVAGEGGGHVGRRRERCPMEMCGVVRSICFINSSAREVDEVGLRWAGGPASSLLHSETTSPPDSLPANQRQDSLALSLATLFFAPLVLSSHEIRPMVTSVSVSDGHPIKRRDPSHVYGGTAGTYQDRTR